MTAKPARPFKSHNHASREAAIAECSAAGMTPWHDRDWLLFANDAGERFAIARYRHAGAPAWAIVPERDLRAMLAERAAAEAAGREREAAAYAHALGEPEPAPSPDGLAVTEYAIPGSQEVAPDCPVALLDAAAHT